MSWLIGKVFGGLGNSVLGYLDKRGERQLSAKVALQNRMAESWTDELIVIWFIVIFSMPFIPFTQEIVREGFTLMTEVVPVWIQQDFEKIIAAVFGFQATKIGIKAYGNKKGVVETIKNKIPKDF